MARYTVHGATQRECQDALDELLAAMPVTVALRPVRSATGAWIARAKRKAPDQQVRGLAVQ
ncbi:hypothetical protein GA0115253_100224 [Streptomyces sp. Termitarium-T10T-6]|nr:hypothetical protein [Streptomyces sp. Termitarium-T10T-6]SCD37536.1 hypothetical protein GA0115253_100224 [Streptomyces sp. Termitarium-T10T-6]